MVYTFMFFRFILLKSKSVQSLMELLQMREKNVVQWNVVSVVGETVETDLEENKHAVLNGFQKRKFAESMIEKLPVT